MDSDEEYSNCGNCFHSRKYRVSDDHEGTIICGNCSLVLGSSTFIHPVLTDQRPKVNRGSYTTSNLTGSDYLSVLSKEFLLKDWIEDGRLPVCVMEAVIHKYEIYCEKFGRDIIAKKQVKCDELLASTLFLSLIEEGAQRTPEQISYITGVLEDRILKIAAHIISRTRAQISLNKALIPSVWIPLLGSELRLTYKQQQALGKVSDQMQMFFSFSPITVVLAVSYILFQKHKSTASNKKILSEIGCVSIPTLNRAIDKMERLVNSEVSKSQDLVPQEK